MSRFRPSPNAWSKIGYEKTLESFGAKSLVDALEKQKLDQIKSAAQAPLEEDPLSLEMIRAQEEISQALLGLDIELCDKKKREYLKDLPLVDIPSIQRWKNLWIRLAGETHRRISNPRNPTNDEPAF